MDGLHSGRGFFSYALTWQDQSYIEPYLKAAAQAGQPPIAMILEDPSHKEWTAMDYRLAKAYELRLTYGDIPPWIDRSDRVSFEARSFISRSAAAVERKQHADEEKTQKRNAKPVFGKRYYAVPVIPDGGPMPTMQEWVEETRRKEGER